VCTRNLQHARSCLLAILWDLKIGRISWPSNEVNCKYYSSLIERKYPLLVKCFGFIDGLNLPVNVLDNEEWVLCLFFYTRGSLYLFLGSRMPTIMDGRSRITAATSLLLPPMAQ
jgi:hypothetical protein